MTDIVVDKDDHEASVSLTETRMAMRVAVIVEDDMGFALEWTGNHEGDAKDVAADWCRKNPGRCAWMMVTMAGSPAVAQMVVKWQK